MRETRIRSLGWADPLEKKMATHSTILAWRIPWTEELGRLQSTRSQSQTQLSDNYFTLIIPHLVQCYAAHNAVSWTLSHWASGQPCEGSKGEWTSVAFCLSDIPVSFGEITPPPLLVVLVGLPVITATPLVRRVSM